MGETTDRHKAPAHRSVIAASFLMGFFPLAASFIAFLTPQGHSIMRGDTVTALGLIALGCLLTSVVYALSPETVRRIMEAGLIVLVIDLNTTGLFWPLLLGWIVLVALLVLKASVMRLLTVFGGITLVATVATSLLFPRAWVVERKIEKKNAGSVAMSNAPRLPALVHIILDEHVGIAGIPRTAGGKEAADDVRNFYIGNGFILFANAYSRHMHTVNAIPDALSLLEKDQVKIGTRSNIPLGQSSYFRILNEIGYDISIIQSDFADFCRNAVVVRCTRYDSAIMHLTTPVGGRIRMYVQ